MTAVRHKSVVIAMMAVMMLYMVSCRSSRQAAGGARDAAASLSLTERYEALTGSYGQWSDVYMPVGVGVESPQHLSISGRATMVRDREIYLSLRFLGMEVAQVYVNTDSIFAVDKYHKMYVAESTSRILGKSGLTVGEIQNMLLGRAITPGKGIATGSMLSDFILTDGDGNWLLAPAATPQGVAWAYTASLTVPPTLTSLLIRISGHNDVECGYAEGVATDCGVFSPELSISAIVGSTKVAAWLRWGLSDAKWNSGRTVNFTPPRGYKRIDVASLLKSFTTF